MRYLKITSAENTDTDYIELNDFNGYLCTAFTTLGISRQYETLEISNRQFSVNNKPQFKDYSLTVHILTKYSLWEQYYRELINFFDRNKKSGFRLYYRPYDGQEMRYILCDIKTTSKTEKMQPITLTVSQNSLWFGEEQNIVSASVVDEEENLTFFGESKDIDGYYGMAFCEDEVFDNYYDINFYYIPLSSANIENKSYNEIPLNFKINGKGINPKIYLYKQENDELIHMCEIIEDFTDNEYIEINSHINENGIWKVNKNTGERLDITTLASTEYDSPYFYIDNGKYYFIVRDNNENECVTWCSFNEEYSE